MFLLIPQPSLKVTKTLITLLMGVCEEQSLDNYRAERPKVNLSLMLDKTIKTSPVRTTWQRPLKPLWDDFCPFLFHWFLMVKTTLDIWYNSSLLLKLCLTQVSIFFPPTNSLFLWVFVKLSSTWNISHDQISIPLKGEGSIIMWIKHDRKDLSLISWKEKSFRALADLRWDIIATSYIFKQILKWTDHYSFKKTSRSVCLGLSLANCLSVFCLALLDSLL